MLRATIICLLSLLMAGCGCCPGMPDQQGQPQQLLKKGVPVAIRFDVRDPWNDRGIVVDKDHVYAIKVSNISNWKDDDIESDVVNGWGTTKSVGSKMIKPMSWLRRNSDAPWYALVGSIRDEHGNDYCFLIGKGIASFIPEASGRLFVYANDREGYYHNNHGSLDITIELIE